MISPLSPLSDLITVVSIEERLIKESCEKIGPCVKTGCIWRAPNGHHFSAPNPGMYSMVPGDTMDRILVVMGRVMKLPPVKAP
jgi:hypothetical protein